MKEIASTITSRGQVTIPAEVRRRLRLGAPAKFAFVIQGDGTVALRPAILSVRTLRGIVSPLPGRETVDFDDQIAEAMTAAADTIDGTAAG